MKILFKIGLFSLITTSQIRAQNLKIEGSVFEKNSSIPISNVLVLIKNSEHKTLTDNYGKFSFDIPNETKLSFSFSSIGYANLDTLLINSKNINISLEKTSINLKNVLINGNLQTDPFLSISKVDLKNRPVRSAQEILRLVPGLFIAQHAGGGKAEQIFLRGFDCDHGTDIQISVDGMPVNMTSHAHGQGYADLHFVIPEVIKNIDYGKGPYYSSHGNLNTAGYVSLNTLDIVEENKVQFELGRFNSKRLLLLTNPIKKLNQNLLIAGEYLYTDGPFISPQKFDAVNVFGKYTCILNSKNKLGVIGSYFKSDWNASGQIPQRAIDQGLISRFGSIDDKEGGNTSRINGSFILKSLLKSSGTLNQQFYYTNYNFKLFSNFTFFLNDSINGDQIKQAEGRNILVYTFNYEVKDEKKLIISLFELGGGIRNDKTSNSELSHTKNKFKILERVAFGNINETNVNLFVNQRLKYQKWSLEIGSRMDYFYFKYLNKLFISQLPDQQKVVLSPKLNLTYKVNNNVQYYIKFGKGFHSNDTRVVIENRGKQTLPAAIGADLGVFKKINNTILFQGALWYLHLQQEFVYVGDAGIIEQGGQTQRFGIDISLRSELSKNIFIYSDFNLCKPQTLGVLKSQSYIPLAPIFTATGGFIYKDNKGFSGGIRYRYLANRSADESNTIIAKGYKIIDANMSYRIKKCEFGLTVENVFNVKWNEAQFNTESRLKNEPLPVAEIHFTPGTPFYLKAKIGFYF